MSATKNVFSQASESLTVKLKKFDELNNLLEQRVKSFRQDLENFQSQLPKDEERESFDEIKVHLYDKGSLESSIVMTGSQLERVLPNAYVSCKLALDGKFVILGARQSGNKPYHSEEIIFNNHSAQSLADRIMGVVERSVISRFSKNTQTYLISLHENPAAENDLKQ